MATRRPPAPRAVSVVITYYNTRTSPGRSDTTISATARHWSRLRWSSLTLRVVRMWTHAVRARRDRSGVPATPAGAEGAPCYAWKRPHRAIRRNLPSASGGGQRSAWLSWTLWCGASYGSRPGQRRQHSQSLPRRLGRFSTSRRTLRRLRRWASTGGEQQRDEESVRRDHSSPSLSGGGGRMVASGPSTCTSCEPTRPCR
jgi:hypothetical protein